MLVDGGLFAGWVITKVSVMTTPSSYSARATYTDQQLLDLWRECAARIAQNGQEYVIDGRTYRNVDADEVRNNIAYFEGRVSAANQTAPYQILAKMRRR